MPNNPVLSLPVLSSPVLSLLVGALLGAALPASGQELPEGPGKELVAAQCNSCHTLTSRVGAGYTPAGWRTVMRMMINNGVPIPPDQLATMTAYLAKTFPEKPKPVGVVIPGPVKVSFKEWPVPTPGSRPHDPLATADGALWYTANAGGLIGKLEPKTGAVTEYKMPDPAVQDPHTLIFDRSGILWFTAQNANRVGRLDPKPGEITLLTPPTPKSRPYGMAVSSKGAVFYVAFGSNRVGSVDPMTMEIREYPLPDAASRPRRITITRDDVVWYTDFSRGYLGRLDPATGQVTEWLSPSGPKSEPYGISAIDDVIWYSESGATPNTVVRFDPKTAKFQSWAIPGGGNIVRNTSVTREGDFVLANSLVNRVTLVKITR